VPVISLRHHTAYRYDRPIRLGPHSIRLRPMQGGHRGLRSYALLVTPQPVFLRWQLDCYGSPLARVVLGEPTDRLDVVVELVADLAPQDPFNFLLEPGAEAWPFRYAAEEEAALGQYLRPDAASPALQAFTAATAPGPTVQLLLDLTARVRERVAYTVRMEPGVWSPERTLGEGLGSCRDSAALLVQLLRLHGIAARFVSGYLVQVPEDGAPESADLHAWAEAFLPGAGWFGLDATSGLATAEGHIALAASPYPTDAAPVTGTTEPAEVSLETRMTVTRMPEAEKE
jgi:transglutaminase-like putative cysteine protease